ncbi:TetR/AcrR family transcriptional regulator [Glycomyces tarimensis]
MESDTADNEGLWARTRRAAYAEITETAMKLFLEQGFEATTIDEIARAAGISRRSFFRYFGTKEDVVLGDMAGEGERAAQALRSRPDSEDVWTALKNAFADRYAQMREQDPERMLKVAEMMYGTPSLRARSIEKHLQWQEQLTPEVRRRLGPGEDDEMQLRARTIVACLVACLDTAGEAWVRASGRRPLVDYFDIALAAVRGD